MEDGELDIGPYFERLSNWRRWGADDVAGTLNLLGPAEVKAASALVQEGVTVSCSRTMRPAGTSSYLHFVSRSGEAVEEEGFATAADWFGVACHGIEHTHLDAHSHVFWDGRMYNDRPAALCTTEHGAVAGGIEPAFGGIVGRGILFDGPAALGVDWLAPGQAIEEADLDRWFEAAGVEVQPGDLLFVRTGRDRWEDAGERTDIRRGFPGLRATCLPWLRRHDISVLITDLIADVVPSGTQARLPVHAVAIVALGMWVVDNAALGPLADACASRGRHAFSATLVPLALANATGCPVNPVATF